MILALSSGRFPGAAISPGFAANNHYIPASRAGPKVRAHA